MTDEVYGPERPTLLQRMQEKKFRRTTVNNEANSYHQGPVSPSPENFAPVPEEFRDAPAAGIANYRNLVEYAEHHARLHREMGDKVLSYAQKFNADCYEKAEQILKEAEEAAAMGAALTKRIQDMTNTLKSTAANGAKDATD